MFFYFLKQSFGYKIDKEERKNKLAIFEKVCRFVNESRLLTNLNDEPMLTAVKYDPYLTIINNLFKEK